MRHFGYSCSIMFVLFFLLGMAGCTQMPSSQMPEIEGIEEEQRTLISNLLYRPEKVSVPVPGAGRAYAPASKEQRKQIVELVSELDISAFKKYEGVPELTNMSVGIVNEYDNQAYSVSLENDAKQEFSYLTISAVPKPTLDPDEIIAAAKPELIILRGPIEAIPHFLEISDMVNSIGQDRSDPENCAQITILADLGPGFKKPGETYWLTKANTAYIKYGLESEYTEPQRIPIEVLEENEYDLQIKIGEALYFLDTETWICFLDGETAYQLTESLPGTLTMRLEYQASAE